MDTDYRFRLAQAQDAAQLGTIGPAIYAESYSHIWSDPEAYARRLESFGQQAVAEFMERPDTETWVAQCREQIVGFLSIVRGTPDPVDGRTDGIEVPSGLVTVLRRSPISLCHLRFECERADATQI
jgi:diamine N-acetyltransferase